MKEQNSLNSIGNLDTGIHNPARLMIIYLLARTKSLDYLQLMRQTGLTSGNITTHLNKLQESGYIRINKSFIGRKPNTAMELTPKGMRAYYEWGENVLHALPEKTMQNLCAKLIGAVIATKAMQYPKLEWYPLIPARQMLKDIYRRSMSQPPVEGVLA
ncbi:MAG: transcriptional regulator [Candidatus Cloacimonetes bacterium]|nr:transcriptional regulator [Candidatus Cloacimonadota bacterium]